MGINKWHRDFAVELARKTNCRIIALPHLDQYISFDEGYADEMPYNISPADFIALIKNADFICTDSFHGTAFSTIYGKKFFTFRRFSGKWTLSTNTRFDSIAERLGIESRLVNESDSVDEMLSRKFEAEEILKRLEDFRDNSLKWLINSLEA